MFHLNLKNIYTKFHNTSNDSEIESCIDKISDGLLSVIANSVRQVPVIRAGGQEAAFMVGDKLNEKISSLLKTPSGSALFNSNVPLSNDPSHSQRPLLVILDRDVDLASMVCHSWTYFSLIDELIGIKLNQIKIEKKIHEINPNCEFWKKISNLSFPDAAQIINEKVNEFNKLRGEVTSEEMDGLVGAVGQLPQITEMKKLVDLHTSIATEILNGIKSTKNDEFYEIELNLNLFKLLNEIENNAKYFSNKIKSFIFIYLRKPELITKKILDQFLSNLSSISDLNESDKNLLNSIKYIKFLSDLRSPSLPPPVRSSSPPPMGGIIGGFAEKVKAHGEGLISIGMKNLKNILPMKDELPVTVAVESLSRNTPSPIADQFSYFDPRAPRGSSVRVKGAFKQIIVFVVGGGSVVEYQNVIGWASKNGTNLIYGSTDIINSDGFLNELSLLGSNIQ